MIKEATADTFLVEIKKSTYEKIKDIIYFEEENKDFIMENIKNTIKDIEAHTNYYDIKIEDRKNGYFIKYYTYGCMCSKFCLTLSEVIIHLRYLRYSKL